MLTQTLRLTFLSTLALGAVACAAPGATSGFDESSIAEDSRFADYERVYIADVMISPALQNREPRSLSRVGDTDRAVTDRDLKFKADDLKKELRQALGGTKRIVGRPGDGVLTIQAEILELASSKPTMADFRTEPGLSQTSRFAGKADVRITISDGERVLATVREDYTGNINDYPYAVGTWADADRGFTIAANKLARLIG